MSPLIDLNLDETPDDIPLVTPGVKTFDVLDIEVQQNAEGEDVQVVSLQVNMPDTEDHERRLWDRFNFKYEQQRVKFKQFCKSAGISSGQPDSADLIGATVKAIVKPRTYQDKDTGETMEARNVQKYLFDAEG